jgi:LPS O-antigen subunit length determinant protein (WzzB/FepE family)
VIESPSNNQLLPLLFAKRKYILGNIVIFTFLSLGLTLIIPKKYTATGIIYPTKSNLIKDVASNPDFGYQLHSERLLQLLYSNDLRNEMVQRFDLNAYYEIDPTQPNASHSLKKQFEKDISFNRTQYLSIEISAEMKNAQLSADLVNNMISYIDTIRENIFRENTRIWVADLETKIPPQKEIVDSILLDVFNAPNSKTTNAVGQNRLAQIEERKKNGTPSQGDNTIKHSIENNYSIQMEKTIANYYMQLGVLNRYQSDYLNGLDKLSMPFPKVYTVAQGEIDDKKTSPSFKINALIGAVFGLIISLLFFSLQQNLTGLNEEYSQ